MKQIYAAVCFALPGKPSYTLKMINDDGSFGYSKIVCVERDRENTTYIFPNPTNRIVHVQSAQQFESIQLLDLGGRILKQWKRPSGDQFDLSDFSSGVYQIRMITKGTTLMERPVISR